MEEKTYDFCEKCGALTLNGVCQSCGHGRIRKKKTRQTSSYSVWTESQSGLNANRNSNRYESVNVSTSRKSATDTNGNISEKKKMKWPMILFIVFGVFFLLSILPMILLGVVNYAPIGSGVPKKTEGDYLREESDWGDRSDLWQDEQDGIAEENGYLNSILDDVHEEYPATYHNGNHYDMVADCIDYAVSYQIEKEFYTFYDEERNISVEVAYVQLAGDDDRDYSRINEQLRSKADSWQRLLEDEQYVKAGTFDNKYMTMDAYITYNDEEKISVVYKIKKMYPEISFNILESIEVINVDLVEGYQIYDSDYFDFDEEFAEEYKERYIEQKNEDLPFTEEEIEENLDVSCIFFYTPFGMEIGFEYFEYELGNNGWVSVNYPDYEAYIIEDNSYE